MVVLKLQMTGTGSDGRTRRLACVVSPPCERSKRGRIHAALGDIGQRLVEQCHALVRLRLGQASAAA